MIYRNYFENSIKRLFTIAKIDILISNDFTKKLIRPTFITPKSVGILKKKKLVPLVF